MSETNVSVNAELRDVAEEVAEQQLAAAARAEVLLNVEDLSVTLFTEDGALPAIRNLSLVMRRGETLAVVGESGCGKSMTALSIMGLLPQPPAKIVGGKIVLEGTDLAQLSRDEMRAWRGSKIGMIFQEPMTSLNPVMTAGRQIREGILVHNPKMPKKDADARALEMIRLVGIPAPEKVFRSYPHELSGGMRQRVMIAMALACKPKLLIADEPTTALDVTIQAQILKLMNDLKREHGTSILFITHDLGVIAQMADDVAVMYCGQVVEMAPAKTLFTDCEFSHPYTEGLMVSIPRLDTPAGVRLESIPGSVPHPLNLPKGCKFAPRCKYCQQRCLEEEPELVNVTEEQQVRCFYPRKEERRANLK